MIKRGKIPELSKKSSKFLGKTTKNLKNLPLSLARRMGGGVWLRRTE